MQRTGLFCAAALIAAAASAQGGRVPQGSDNPATNYATNSTTMQGHSHGKRHAGSRKPGHGTSHGGTTSPGRAGTSPGDSTPTDNNPH